MEAAVALADKEGIEALSMRRLAHELGVEAMSLYNHVENKEDLLNGMADALVGEIETPENGVDWKLPIRQRAMSAREVLLRHPWAPGVFVTRTDMTPTMLTYFDSIIGVLLRGGFSPDLAHHSLHALGSRIIGFTQELFETNDEESNQEITPLLIQQMSGQYPNLAEMMKSVSHDESSTVGGGCDDQFEFEFGLDLILDGLERLRDSATTGRTS